MTALTNTRSLRGLGTLTTTEARLFLRDRGSVVFAVIFPTIIVLGVGFGLPDMRDPITDLPKPWTGMPAIHLFSPLALALAAATVALSTLPTQIVTARELGVLRRMSTTPMRPHGVLIAQVLINLAALLIACSLALGAAALAFGTPAPASPFLLIAVFTFGTAAIAGVGLVIAAVARKASAANGIGMLVYFPMLFFAGMWTPGPMMPDAVAAVARFTPMGAMSQALNIAWFGGDFPGVQLIVMAAYIAVLYPLAARLFRWS